MFILDTMLIGGLRFVFDKIATAVDTELNDETHLHEQLLAAEMRLDLGEITTAEYDALATDIHDRLRAIKERQRGTAAFPPGDYKITGIDATFEGDEHK
jgi:hypothetical protein